MRDEPREMSPARCASRDGTRVLRLAVRDSRDYRRTCTFGLGRGWGSQAYAMRECVSVEIGMQMHSNSMKNKNDHNSYM